MMLRLYNMHLLSVLILPSNYSILQRQDQVIRLLKLLRNEKLVSALFLVRETDTTSLDRNGPLAVVCVSMLIDLLELVI
mgnify:CR=1 FL=1